MKLATVTLGDRAMAPVATPVDDADAGRDDAAADVASLPLLLPEDGERRELEAPSFSSTSVRGFDD